MLSVCVITSYQKVTVSGLILYLESACNYDVWKHIQSPVLVQMLQELMLESCLIVKGTTFVQIEALCVFFFHSLLRPTPPPPPSPAFLSFFFYTFNSTRTFCEYLVRIIHIASAGDETNSSGMPVVIPILYEAGTPKDHSLQRVR